MALESFGHFNVCLYCRMRILLTHHLPLEGSVSGRLTRSLADGLAAAGHEVLCLVVQGRRWPASESETYSVEQIRCWPGDAQADLAFDLPTFAPHPATRLTFESLREDQAVEYRNSLRRRLDRSIERFNPHVIHCQHAWLFAHLALESGAPYVIGVLGDEWRALQTAPRYRRLVEQAVENASRLLVHRGPIADETAQLFPDIAGRIERVAPPSCVAGATHPREELMKALRLRDDLPLVVYAGGLAPQSGVDVLLNAKAALAARGQDASLVLCGDGPQRAELQTQAGHQQLADVSFVGELPTGDRCALLAAADVVVSPGNDAEAYYLALAALACGTPVVAARQQELADLIDAGVGELIAPNDHELLAEAVGRALAKQWKRQKGAAAKQRAEQLCGSSTERHVTLYQETLEQRYGSHQLP